MIYFLVNNNYHRIDFEEHLNQLREIDEVALIQIPHTLDLIKWNERYKIYTILPLGYKNYFNIKKVIKKIKEIEGKIIPNEGDILFIFTEYEIINHIIVNYFKSRRAKVYLLEEGLATYLESCYEPNEKISFKMKFFYLYLRYILKFKYIKILRTKTMSPFTIADRQIDKILTYLNIKTYRKIEQVLVKKEIKEIPCLDEKKIIFLNEDIYNFFTDYNTYINDLVMILEILSMKFEKVVFKFHPREYNNPQIIKLITEKIKQIENVIILDEQEPIEILANKIKAKYVASYMSLALINLYYMGMEPIYIYTLLESIKNERDFQATTIFLQDLNYNFINDFEVINSNYRSNLCLTYEKSQTLKQIILSDLAKSNCK